MSNVPRANGAVGNDETKKLLWDNLWNALKDGLPPDCVIPTQAVVLYFVGETKPKWLSDAIAQANGYDEKECDKRVYHSLRDFIEGSRKQIQELKDAGGAEYYDPRDLRPK